MLLIPCWPSARTTTQFKTQGVRYYIHNVGLGVLTFFRSVLPSRLASSGLPTCDYDIGREGLLGGPTFYTYSFDVVSWLSDATPGPVVSGFVVTGHSKRPLRARHQLEENQGSLDQSKVPFSRRSPVLSIMFLVVGVPYHSEYLAGATEMLGSRRGALECQGHQDPCLQPRGWCV